MLNCLNYNTAVERCRQENRAIKYWCSSILPLFRYWEKCDASSACFTLCSNTPAKHIPRNRELIAEVIFNWGTHFLLPIPNSLYVTMQFPFSSSMELVEALWDRAALKMVGSKYEIYHLRHLHLERMVSPCLFTFWGTCREVSNVNINWCF